MRRARDGLLFSNISYVVHLRRAQEWPSVGHAEFDVRQPGLEARICESENIAPMAVDQREEKCGLRKPLAWVSWRTSLWTKKGAPTMADIVQTRPKSLQETAR